MNTGSLSILDLWKDQQGFGEGIAVVGGSLAVNACGCYSVRHTNHLGHFVMCSVHIMYSIQIGSGLHWWLRW